MASKTPAINKVAQRFSLHLRLAREMRADGYLRAKQEWPEYPVKIGEYTHESRQLCAVGSYFGLSREKMVSLYNAGFVELNGLDCERAISRYLQCHPGRLSVRLLAYMTYSEHWPDSLKVKNQVAHDCLSALKIDGKLSPPKLLEPYVDAACRGEETALEKVALWVRELLDSTDKPHSWEFIGVRLALIEGSYTLWTRPIPRLRRLRKLRGLAKKLRAHSLLSGCVTPVASGGQNKVFTYLYHRPGTFWDL